MDFMVHNSKLRSHKDKAILKFGWGGVQRSNALLFWKYNLLIRGVPFVILQDQSEYAVWNDIIDSSMATPITFRGSHDADVKTRSYSVTPRR